ncbi:hypothetical protein KP509_24G010000 [Ceratopteris richardii]|uniref:Uncharacterized protein n=1 Tax=Ceratopteris richardii TaxID=49495 RepID=A0A8T2RT83_CERRI|nr:hypothetical protein KP509_24G010000 [Ceratopteris richardii]KAH7299411.1 hypothetical protein KP509_24G010000 [Ceratopteris richardii]
MLSFLAAICISSRQNNPQPHNGKLFASLKVDAFLSPRYYSHHLLVPPFSVAKDTQESPFMNSFLVERKHGTAYIDAYINVVAYFGGMHGQNFMRPLPTCKEMSCFGDMNSAYESRVFNSLFKWQLASLSFQILFQILHHKFFATNEPFCFSASSLGEQRSSKKFKSTELF